MSMTASEASTLCRRAQLLICASYIDDTMPAALQNRKAWPILTYMLCQALLAPVGLPKERDAQIRLELNLPNDGDYSPSTALTRFVPEPALPLIEPYIRRLAGPPPIPKPPLVSVVGASASASESAPLPSTPQPAMP